MTSVLDGGWNERPGMMTITIPLPDELFVEGREPQVIADFLAGTAARLAAKQYLEIAASVEKARAEGELAQAERSLRIVKAFNEEQDSKHPMADAGQRAADADDASDYELVEVTPDDFTE